MAGHTSSPSRRAALKALGLASGAATLTATGTATASTGRIPRDLRPGGALDRLAADLASKDQFSGSLLVTHRSRTTLSRSFGMANKETGVRNGPETRFTLASVTKLLTAVAVHQLVQRHRLGYHDKLGDHLDGFPAEMASKVTIHHLFTHSSGLGDYHNLPGYREAAKTWDGPEEVFNGTVDFVRRTDLLFPPGTRIHYSNSAYCLLGAIVARASGRSYYDYMAEHVFKGARMRDSGFFTKPQWRSDPTIAHPYYKKPGSSSWTDGLEEHAYIGLPPGGAFATCADLEAFARALLHGDDLLDVPHTDLMLGAKLPRPSLRPRPGDPAPPPAFIGYGNLATLSQGQWIHGHNGGGSFGASTNIDVFPGSGWVVVVLGNYADPRVDPIVELARRLILDD